MSWRAAATIALIILLRAAPHAVQLALDPRAINDAIAIGQSRLDTERTRYHAPYRLTVRQPPLDYIDVVTPFRRIVLTAQGRAVLGDRGFGQRDALALLGGAPDEIDLQFELTFHPLNTYIGIPDYAIAVVSRSTPTLRVVPRAIERVPRFGARVDSLPLPYPQPGVLAPPGTSQPMLGGTVIARFDGRLLDGDAASTVVMSENGVDLASVLLDLRALR